MRHYSAAFLAVFGLFLAPAFSARAQTDPAFPEVVIFATNSIHLSRSVEVVSGDVVVNDLSAGATLDGAELSLDQQATVAGGAWADSIVLDTGAGLGSWHCNDGVGLACAGLSLPVFPPAEVPVFQQTTLRAGAVDVVVGTGGTAVLAAGDYADLTVGPGGTVVFTGGVYNFGSILVGRDGALVFQGPADVRILGVFESGADSFIGPDPGTTSASRIVFHVAGSNRVADDPSSLPPAARVGQRSVVEANFYVPAGTFLLEQGSSVTGALLARDVELRKQCVVAVASFFNPPPTAEPQEVTTNGTAPLLITLAGSDPDGETLSFSIVSGPAAGSLSGVTQVPPANATVTYTANPPGTLEDRFVFRVTDPNGGFGDAVVLINPDDDGGGPPAPSGAVIASDAAYEVLADASSDLTLIAVADVGPLQPVGAFEFTIVGGPGHGTLTTPVVTGSTAAVTYTTSAFAGGDSFVFQACADLDANGDTLGAGECDTATVTLQVLTFLPPPPPVAQPLKATTEIDTPVVLTLTGDAGEGDGEPGDGRSVAVPVGLAAPRAAAKIAGINLTITAFSAPAQVELGEVVGDRILVTLTNNGDLDIPAETSSAIGFYVSTDAEITTSDTLLTGGRENLFSSAPGGLPAGASISDFLFAGASINVASPEGEVWIGVLADEFDDLEEGDETDNAASQAILIGAPAPDLVVSSFTHDPAAPDAETVITFTAVVENAGAAEAGGSTLCFEIGGETCDGSPGTLFAVPSLAPDATFTVTRSAQLPPQTYQNTAVADYGGDVAESVETNNTAIDTYVVSPAGASPAVFTVVSLPAHGTLLDASGALIAAVPADLTHPNVTYVPAGGFTGTDFFEYAPAGFLQTVARVDLRVVSLVAVGNCVNDPAGCDNGRP